MDPGRISLPGAKTMKYILNDDVALRSWIGVPYAFYRERDPFAHGLRQEEFALLLSCCTVTDLPEASLTKSLLSRGLLRVAEEGEKVADWQRHRICDNRYMPQMNLQITARCNYNCVHCFNATDNSPLLTEIPFERLTKLLEEAELCGIHAFTITGGEPLMHRHFLDIVKDIYARHMFLAELNTNGFFLTRELLTEFRSIGCRPLIKISFDGLGYHDWMRGRKGAEEDALRAVRLCTEMHFPVMIQYNVNKKNLPTLYETLKLLNSLGVEAIRLIRTSPAPRWEANAAGQTFSHEEYTELALSVLKHYSECDYRAELTVWQVATLYPRDRSFSLAAVRGTAEDYRDSIPLCKGVRGMIAVGATGQVYPCLQMSGWMDEHQVNLGNVFTDGLPAILKDSPYLSCICQTVRDRREKNSACASCPYLKYCLGGCPALAMIDSTDGSLLAPDPGKCYFYANNCYERFTAALSGYRNRTPLPQPLTGQYETAH